MKRLVLLRHAKTEQDSVSGKDFDRRLTDPGRADAERIGRAIRDLGMTFDLGYCSAARRAVETAELAGLVVRPEARIYNAPVDQLLDLLRGADAAAMSLIMVGHNPGFEMLLAMLTGAEPDMPTGSLAEIELAVEQWSEVAAGKGQLMRFLRPNEIG